MWKKRIALAGGVFITSTFLLLCRLAQIQLWEPESFSSRRINLIEESVRQRSEEVVIDDGRGGILDKNGISLTRERLPVLILFPFLKNGEWSAEKVASIIGMEKWELLSAVKKAKEPIAFGDPDPIKLTPYQMKAINDLKIPGVFAVERKYERQKIQAHQLVGAQGENEGALRKRYPDKDLPGRTVIGVSGLEKSFDEFLIAEGKSKLVYHVDGGGRPLFGTSVRYTDPANPFYPVSLKTTIDLEVQSKAEELVSSYKIAKGGLVLLDIPTNSIVALVSRPAVDDQDPFSGPGLQNIVLKQQIMGSVFKTVIAAAAIDHGLDKPGRLFDCSRTITGEPDLVYQHGMLDFSGSFARSCNNAFATLAKDLKEIDPNIIEDYASRLSLTGGVGWKGDVFHLSAFRQLPEEDAGRVFLSASERKDSNFVALTGIGQKEVRATPLAVANMMATIARGGKKEMVRAVSEIDYKNGSALYSFKQKGLEGQTLSPFTALRLQKMLRQVVTDSRGTGRWFSNLPYEVAGKSGTAETGKFIGEKQLHNKWFAGYFPYENPRYALVAVNLDVFGDEGGVNPLFADMVNYLYNHDN